MKSSVIRQAITSESLFGVIATWCKAGAGHKTCSLKILSAFASGAGVSALAPLFDIFLADGNRVEIIIGIDRNGTDRGALQHLQALAAAYPRQCDVRVFNAPSRIAIFHPKLYLLRTRRNVNFVIGSANLTSGGLSSNFESLFRYENCAKDSQEAQHVISVWETYAFPRSPLKQRFLRALTPRYLVKLLRQLPSQNPQEQRSTNTAVQDLWRPLSRLPLPRSSRVVVRSTSSQAGTPRAYLLMDVLKETRHTQMQIPLLIIEKFFSIERRQVAQLSISIWTATGLSQPITRPVVISQGPRQRRLMRRIEMPQIRGLKRPLAVLFIRLRGRRKFAFKLLPQDTKLYRIGKKLLQKHGQQGKSKRKFLIGNRWDQHWRSVQALLRV